MLVFPDAAGAVQVGPRSPGTWLDARIPAPRRPGNGHLSERPPSVAVGPKPPTPSARPRRAPQPPVVPCGAGGAHVRPLAARDAGAARIRRGPRARRRRHALQGPAHENGAGAVRQQGTGRGPRLAGSGPRGVRCQGPRRSRRARECQGRNPAHARLRAASAEHPAQGLAEGVPHSLVPDQDGRADYFGSSINQAARCMQVRGIRGGPHGGSQPGIRFPAAQRRRASRRSACSSA
jgi:hypothetical protein